MANPSYAKDDFSCGGMVWDPSSHKVLMIKVRNLFQENVWTFPKGHPNEGETDEQAAVREVEEETGWRCQIVCPLTVVSYGYIHKETKVNKKVRWFFMRPAEKRGSFDPDEVLICEWRDLKGAEDLIAYPSDRILLHRIKAMI